MKLQTPYYLLDENKLLANMLVIDKINKLSGAKCVLALKCFSTWSVFNLMRPYMAGTTSSSLYEAKLGHEEFGGETHAYCVGYSKEDILEIRKFADKVIFNSISQLETYYELVADKKIGLRVNPGISNSGFDLANPTRKFSRLGILDKNLIAKQLSKIDGLMFHYNCENADFNSFSEQLDYLGETYGEFLFKLNWISLGGGIYFTKAGYPIEAFCNKLKAFSEKYNIQIYLEPGESSITNAGELVTSVVDVVHNEIDIAIVDACIEGHMLDLLIYRLDAKVLEQPDASFKYMVAGRSCLAGDVFGTYKFPDKLKIGDEVRFQDAAGYTMVKKNWFNGLQMPSIVIKKLNGELQLIRQFTYEDFKYSLS